MYDIYDVIIHISLLSGFSVFFGFFLLVKDISVANFLQNTSAIKHIRYIMEF